MITLGCDPGLDGAIVFLEAPHTIKYVLELGRFKDGKHLDVPELRKWLAELITLAPPLVAVLEKPSAMPASHDGHKGQGVASAFNFGKTCGALLGLFVGMGLPVLEVIPSVWKANMGLPADKRVVCAAAESIFKHDPAWKRIFFGPRGGPRDGLAEAAFLAQYGQRFRSTADERYLIRRPATAEELCS